MHHPLVFFSVLHFPGLLQTVLKCTTWCCFSHSYIFPACFSHSRCAQIRWVFLPSTFSGLGQILHISTTPWCFSHSQHPWCFSHSYIFPACIRPSDAHHPVVLFSPVHFPCLVHTHLMRNTLWGFLTHTFSCLDQTHPMRTTP